jgi:hypothetical protein
MLALAVTWLLFVPTADWLAHHDVGSAAGSLHETALDNARGRLLTLSAGLFAAGALIFTARNFTVSRQTLELTEQGQVTERYTKAIEQLGSDKQDVRIGGIYALERIARDSARDHPTVMEVLAAFIREHSREPWPVPEATNSRGREHRFPRPDVQAALTVIGRRDSGQDRQRIDLTAAVLPGALLFGDDLTRVRLADADLSHAHLRLVKLAEANLYGANLAGADLTGAELSAANLTGANLTGADLTGAKFPDAILTSADLTNAILRLADFTGAELHHAQWSAAWPAPDEWELETGSLRLKWAPGGRGPRN